MYGLRLLQRLRATPDIETHVLVSEAGWCNLELETGMTSNTLASCADQLNDTRDVGACVASGSFPCAGMVVAPCSMRTLAAIAQGLGDNLITRAADVTLKERRRLVLMVRETPLSLIHLRNMVSATEAGAIICPPVPAFYLHPQSVDEVVAHSVTRVLDLLDVPQPQAVRWAGLAPVV